MKYSFKEVKFLNIEISLIPVRIPDKRSTQKRF
jgi:hypothetical protein